VPGDRRVWLDEVSADHSVDGAVDATGVAVQQVVPQKL
jgi:hypothetical protein